MWPGTIQKFTFISQLRPTVVGTAAALQPRGARQSVSNLWKPMVGLCHVYSIISAVFPGVNPGAGQVISNAN